MCICVTTFYENFFFLLFLPVLLSHSELEPSAASVNLSLSLSLSVYFFRISSFMHCEHFGMGIEAIGMNGTKHVFSHFPQFP